MIVLSADHGTPEAPECMIEKGFRAGRLDLDKFDFSKLDKELNARFGIGKEVINMTFHPYVYLDQDRAAQRVGSLEDASIAHNMAMPEKITILS